MQELFHILTDPHSDFSFPGWIQVIILSFYTICLLVLSLYAFMQLSLISNYLRIPTRKIKKLNTTDNLPDITVQLPMFNERYVAERIIRAVSELNYPKDKLQIQVIDDSTDDTVAVIREVVEELNAEGFNIAQIHRENRRGFKAGALRDAMPLVTGELIAIFDADFIPDPDFLLETVGEFQDENIGVVQTHWGHLNKNHSLLTKLQAFGLDGHFSIEQHGRNSGGHFINFNGTAGVWRKACIEDAGGWEDDTLTEDLDLSYRAQLKGWKFVYLEKVESPAELPITMAGLKSQQHRWMKGGAECFQKNAKRISRSKLARPIDKLFGYMHLFNSSIFIVILIFGSIGVPLINILKDKPELGFIGLIVSWIVMLTLYAFYLISYREHNEFKWFHLPLYTLRFFQFLSISTGLSLNNTIASIEGHLGIKSSFVRTPKFNINTQSKFKGNNYHQGKVNLQLILEGLLAIVFWCVVIGFAITGNYRLATSYCLLSFGFSYVFGYSLYELITVKRSPVYESATA